ncbi:cysteine--tRNA ligase [Patescibacteria group bacterium]|nr:cysteine--tRNA ligase [Patescibacteria group bacterium]
MLKLYNTLSRKKEVFRPKKGKKVNLFVCGITPYDFAHIGHARTYIVFDMIAKYLREKGFDVFYLQNITDIEDKIIQRAREKKITLKKLARQFEKEYLKDMKILKIDSITKYARATDYIKEIINQVKRLKAKGFAYKIRGGIYYDISKLKDYGKLSNRTVSQAEDAVSRIDESKEKKNKGDFCLWKLAPYQTYSGAGSKPAWPSPWGPGKPGWHIEDTAITEKHFGPQYDIHGGARDLMFPHHEAEIAQMEAISDKVPMVKYWLHAGFLIVKGRKMSKSLGNFITIQDFLKNSSPRILRFFILKSHYRSPINYTEKKVLQTKQQLERIDEFVGKIENFNLYKFPRSRKFEQPSNFKKLILATQKGFDMAMENDFNTPSALASVFHLISRGNFLLDKEKLTQLDAKNILKFLKKVDKIFNFIFWARPTKEKIPREILGLVIKRGKYRKQGNWKTADKIRRKVKKMGYLIEDVKKGQKIKRINQ